MDYKDIAKSYDALYKEEQLKKLKLISKYLKVKKSDRLLDVGCGTGISTNFFDCDSCGIDICEELIKLGKGDLRIGCAEDIKFNDSYFDVLISVTAVHHFNLIKFVKEVKRVVKSKIVITVLKKSSKFDYIVNYLKRSFKLVKEVDEEKDLILFFEKV